MEKKRFFPSNGKNLPTLTANKSSRTIFGTGPEEFCLVCVQLESIPRSPPSSSVGVKKQRSILEGLLTYVQRSNKN